MSPAEADRPPSRGLRATLSALIALAALPLLPEMERAVSLFAIFALGLGAGALVWPGLAPKRWLLVALTLSGIANVFAAYLTLFGHAGVALLLTMSALKTLEIRRDRDLRVGFILVMFIIVTGFLFDQSLSTAMYLAAVLIGAVALTIELSRGGTGRQWRPSLRLALVLTVQAAPLGLILFVLFPRLDAPLWQLDLRQRTATTGMSDWLELGSVSRLIPSDEVAFRVRFDGSAPDPRDLYWRGPVLWQTDGRRWEKRAESGLNPSPAPLEEAVGVARYEVTLEPTDQRWLFALDLPVEVPEGATLTSDYQVLVATPLTERRRYRLSSATRYTTGALTPSERRSALQTPPAATPRLRALAASFSQPNADPATIVQGALGFFRDQPFYYSLEPPPLGPQAIDQFLFETRRGYCEHFASSFALLMRLAGVPARVVLGYLGGERNPLGDYFSVRQSDAHAWAEVWLDRSGWTRVDPTAVIPPERIERGAAPAWLTREAPVRFRLGEATGAGQRILRSLSQLADSVNAAWHAWVLAYSTERQGALLRSLGLGFIQHYGLIVAAVIGSALLLALLSGLFQWRAERETDPAQRLFTRFCRILARQGVARGRGEGPLDFARRASRLRPDLAPAIESVIDAYLPLRYGRTKDPDRLVILRAGVRRLGRRFTGLAPTAKPLRPTASGPSAHSETAAQSKDPHSG